eukprot:TRINITY_DN7792_c0_g6_i1.p1 TRINITY_DN7792_c0_g6~~TRINITY_DN7792_c0_g6_i1.p1  ORF type:complete len:357 (+),score=105.03 TRINITY_DN7792_c0_g6_i1:2-1072(+)
MCIRDRKKTIDIVENWLNGGHLEVMKAVETSPKLRLDYLSNLIQAREEDIERILKDEATYSSPEASTCKQLILVYVQLLCSFKKNETLLEFVKKKYCPLSEVLGICVECGNSMAVAYILKATGEYEKALSVYLQIFAEYSGKLISNQNKKDYISLSLEECREIYEEALEVCSKNASVNSRDKKLWFALLEHLYELWHKVSKVKQTGSTPLNRQFLDQVPKAINSFIKDLLYVMVQYISIEDIIQEMIERLAELDIESLREIISSMIISFVHQERVFDSAMRIQVNSLMELIREKVKAGCRAISVKDAKCSRCGRDVRNGLSKVYHSFTCGHIYHSYCIDSINICPICLKDPKGKLY